MSPLSRKFSDLSEFPDDVLAQCDIAELNLACAAGLPGTEELDFPGLLNKLDQWADEVRHQDTAALASIPAKSGRIRELGGNFPDFGAHYLFAAELGRSL